MLAIRDDGSFWTWGANASGQLGKGVMTPAGTGAGSTIPNDWSPWQLLGSLRPSTADNWAVADDAKSPFNDELNVSIDRDSLTLRFDRVMRTESDFRGTIAIDNGASVDVADGVWSENDTVFTAPLTLAAVNEEHSVNMSGFSDDFASRSKPNSEIHPWTWAFTTEGLFEGDNISFDQRACATCHFIDNLRREHTFVHSRGSLSSGNDYDNSCAKCHGVPFAGNDKINWNMRPSIVSDNKVGTVAENGCISCHGGTAASIHAGEGGNRMLSAHAVDTTVDTGCSASGCHGPILGNSDAGFGFGVMDLASAHADFWIAANDGRVAYPDAVSETMQDDSNPFGCGACHGRAYDEDSRLRSPIVTHLADVPGAVSCSSCHVVPDGNNPLDMTMHFTQRELVPGLATALGLDAAVTPARASQSALDFVEALSSQARAELDVGASTGDRLEPGVLDPEGSQSGTESDCQDSTGSVTCGLASGESGVSCDCDYDLGCCSDPSCTVCPCSPAYGSSARSEVPSADDAQQSSDRYHCPCYVGNDCTCLPDLCNCDSALCTCTTGSGQGQSRPPQGGGGQGDSAGQGTSPDDDADAGADDGGDDGLDGDPAGQDDPVTNGTQGDGGAGPQTGDEATWYLQITTLAALVAALAAMGLLRGRRSDKLKS
jgi:hypothetical protein